MYLCIGPGQLPEGCGLDLMAAAWSQVLAEVPPPALEGCYLAAMRGHSAGPGATFPLAATEILAAWQQQQADQAELATRPSVAAGHLLPAPPATASTPATATTLAGLLAALGRDLADPQATVGAVLHLTLTLQRRDPQARVETWRARFAAARAGDAAPTLASLVSMLLGVLPPPTEAPASPRRTAQEPPAACAPALATPGTERRS